MHKHIGEDKMDNIEEIRELLHKMSTPIGVFKNFLGYVKELSDTEDFKECYDATVVSADKLSVFHDKLQKVVKNLDLSNQ